MADAKDEAVQSYRYIRIALVMTVLYLFASVVVEFVSTGSTSDGFCLRDSLSDYYYTPVRLAFTGSLIAIGVLVVAVRSRMDYEDIALNLTGMFALIVAVVPTRPPATKEVPPKGSGIYVLAEPQCSSVQVDASTTNQIVVNSMCALIVVGVLSFSYIIYVAIQNKWEGRMWLLLAIGVAVASLFAGWFIIAQFILHDLGWFSTNAHTPAAVLLFCSIVIVVFMNFRDAPRQLPRVRQLYGLILILMVSVVVIALAMLIFHWSEPVFWVEVGVIILFGAFWVVQTLNPPADAASSAPRTQGVVGEGEESA